MSAFWVDAAGAVEAARAGSALATFVCSAVEVVALGCPDVWDSTETALLFDVASGLSPVLRLARFSADIRFFLCALRKQALTYDWGRPVRCIIAGCSLEGFAPIH